MRTFDYRGLLGRLQIEHWNLQNCLARMCGELKKARDEEAVIKIAASALLRLTEQTRVCGIARRRDDFIRVYPRTMSVRSDLVTPLIERAEQESPGSVFMVDPLVCSKLVGSRGPFRDGLCTTVGVAHETMGMLILAKTGALLDWDFQALSLVAQIAMSFLARAALMEVKGWREMAQKIAHLTATPLALAQCEVEDLLAGKSQDQQKSLEVVRDFLEEANAAIERAFLFDCSSETLVWLRFDLCSVLRRAAGEARMNGSISINDGELLVYGNPFRVHYAIRDLLVCAKQLSPKPSAELRANGRDLHLTISMPAEIRHDFDPTILFSPQHHIEARWRKKKKWPLSISLWLAKRLLEEKPPHGKLDAILMNDGGGLQFVATIPMSREVSRGIR